MPLNLPQLAYDITPRHVADWLHKEYRRDPREWHIRDLRTGAVEFLRWVQAKKGDCEALVMAIAEIQRLIVALLRGGADGRKGRRTDLRGCEEIGGAA